MKIYFTAAISRATKKDKERYKLIVDALEDMGHSVIHSGVLKKKKKDIESQSKKEAIAIQRKMSKWKKQADLTVAEVSNPSFGVGQEINEALMDNRQVIALYHDGAGEPHILTDKGEDALYVDKYSKENISSVLDHYVEYAKSRSDTRFNFFISPQIGSYLDWIARTKRIPRAVYLRNLIKKDMKENKEYNK